MRYNAFISYRHGGLDGQVAEWLHHLLETYRIPSKLAKEVGMKKLTRVFRDRDELPTSANLSESINNAIRDSEWLIVICSPRLRESIWCMQEVDLFGELHGKDRIIALLVEGEPIDSFPEQITFREINGEKVAVEPLAADVRADTLGQTKKLLKTEVLRILAPILGCGYDNLRQRHRERFVRRVVTGTGIAFALSLGFGGFAQYQYMRINVEMQQKLINQSLVLSEYSKQVFDNGDPETAILLANAALPQTESTRPYVPEAESALATALGVYNVSDGYRFHKTTVLPRAPSELRLSPNGKFASVIYGAFIRLIDTETGEQRHLLRASGLTSGAVFLPDGTFVYSGEKGVSAFNPSDGATLWTIGSASSLAVNANGTRIAALDEKSDSIYIYDISGKEINLISLEGRKQRKLPDNAPFNPKENAFALNADGSILVASFEHGELIIWDISVPGGQEIAKVEEAKNIIRWNAVFSGSNLALTNEYESGGGEVKVYDMDYMELIHEDESEVIPFVAAADKSGEALYVAGYNAARVFRQAVVSRLILPTGSAIAALAVTEDYIIAAAQNGKYFFVDADSGEVTEYSSPYVCNLLDIGGGYALTGGNSGVSFRILRYTDNSILDVLTYEGNESYLEARINADGDRAIFYSPKAFRVYSLSEGLISDESLPDADEVFDQRYDHESGELAVIYRDKRADIYDKNGKAAGTEATETIAGLTIKTIFGKIIIDVSGTGLDGDFIGGSKSDNGYIFAMSGEAGGIYEIINGSLKKALAIETPDGHADAYFTENYVVVAEPIGFARVYSRRDWKFVKEFEYTDSYLADISQADDILFAQFIRTDGSVYALLLDPDTFSEKGSVDGFCGITEGLVVSDAKRGSLRSAPILSLGELEVLAKERLEGRVLTAREMVQYHID